MEKVPQERAVDGRAGPAAALPRAGPSTAQEALS